jgi:cyanate permease
MAGALGAGAGAGPFTIGLVRDYFGKYDAVAMALGAAMLVVSLLIGTLSDDAAPAGERGIDGEPQGEAAA